MVADTERAAEAADGVDLTVPRPPDDDADLAYRARAERSKKAAELALAGLAGAAEQRDVGEVGQGASEPAKIATVHGDPSQGSGHHAYFPPRATRRASEKRICRSARSKPTSVIGAL